MALLVAFSAQACGSANGAEDGRTDDARPAAVTGNPSGQGAQEGPGRGMAWVILGADTVVAEVAATAEARRDGLMYREELAEGVVATGGGHCIYRVTKRKLTSLEAASELASLAGVQTGVVAMAGLKDRQGVTSQFMSVPKGREVRLQRPELKIEPVGYSRAALSSGDSIGNRRVGSGVDRVDVRLGERGGRVGGSGAGR